MLVHLEKIGICFFVRFMNVVLGLLMVLQVTTRWNDVALGASMRLFTVVNMAMSLWWSSSHSGFLYIKISS